MWLVAKYKKTDLNFFKSNILDKVDKDVEFYNPKIKYQKIIRKKLYTFEQNILGNYILCYHPSFKNKNFVNFLKSVKGLEYFLPSYESSQRGIIEFINYSKNFENNEGFLTQEFFDTSKLKKIKFLTGPFAGQICKIISEKKKILNILVGNITTSISKKRNLLYLPA